MKKWCTSDEWWVHGYEYYMCLMFCIWTSDSAWSFLLWYMWENESAHVYIYIFIHTQLCTWNIDGIIYEFVVTRGDITRRCWLTFAGWFEKTCDKWLRNGWWMWIRPTSVVSGLVYMILYHIEDFLLLCKYPNFMIPQSSKNVQMFRLTRRDAARGHRTELREISEGALAEMGRWCRNDAETEQNLMGDKKTRHMGFHLCSWRLFCYCIFFSKGRVLVSVLVCLFFPACD